MSAQYYSGHKPNIPFEDPLCRIAYLYYAVLVNAYVIENVLQKDKELSGYLNASSRANSGIVRICSLGGGPGTEFLGLAKWVEENPVNHRVTLLPLLSDRTDGWQKDWRRLRNRMNVRLKGKYGDDSKKWPVAITPGNFSTVDVEDFGSIGGAKDLYSQNLYISCYLLSHVFHDFGNLNNFYAELVKRVPAGSKFLFIDRDAPKIEEAVKDVAKSSKLKLSDVHHADSNTISSDEDLTDLGAIFGELREVMQPRLQWKIFWAVGTTV